MYKTHEDFAEVLSRIPELKCITGEDIGTDYCHDECPGVYGRPEAVVEVHSTEEISSVLKCCYEAGVPVTPRGAGTGQAGGAVAIEGGVMLSLKGMNQILEVSEDKQTIRVQAGALLQDIKAEAERHGLCYPPDPGEKTATIGGNAATDASGPSAVKYGSTGDYIESAAVVFPDGAQKTLSGEELKEIIGSEGTLAVIAELTLRLIKKPGADAILLFPFADTETCMDAAAAMLSKGYAPAVMEYMDTDIVEFSGGVTGSPIFPVELDGKRVGATLMVALEGENDDAVMERMEEIAETADALKCIDILVGDTPGMKRDFWAAHDAFHTSMESGAKNSAEYNITVPTEKIAEMTAYAKAKGGERGLKAMVYAHVGSGGMHIHAVSDGSKDNFTAAAREFASEIYVKCAGLGGRARGEYGIGCVKKEYVGEEALKAFYERKTKYDPKGILNPGKAAE